MSYLTVLDKVICVINGYKEEIYSSLTIIYWTIWQNECLRPMHTKDTMVVLCTPLLSCFSTLNSTTPSEKVHTSLGSSHTDDQLYFYWKTKKCKFLFRNDHILKILEEGLREIGFYSQVLILFTARYSSVDMDVVHKWLYAYSQMFLVRK